MEQWEYLTRFVEARATKKEIKTFIKENFDKKPVAIRRNP
jgi:ribosomal protein L23